MSKISDRLKDYQTQMSIYAEQHKLILASDVLDMIEQLQDDLKDDVEKVVKKLKQDTPYITKNGVEFITIGDAVCTVRKGGVE